MHKIYGFSKVNAGARGHTRDLRVLWAAEEMQRPFELVGMDHPAHDLSTDAYRQLSPFEQIPSINDDGLLLSESAAILVYLAKKSGRLIAGDLAGEAQVVLLFRRDELSRAAAAQLDGAGLDGGWQLRQAPRVPGRPGKSGADEPGALVGRPRLHRDNGLLRR